MASSGPTPAAGTSASREKWRGRSLGVRLRILNRLWVDTPYHTPVLDQVERINDYVAVAKSSRGILVCCEPGGGKTALCRQLRRRYPDIRTTEATRRQLAMLQLPKLLSHPQLTSELLKSVGDPAWDGPPSQRTFRRTIEVVKRSGLRILVVDNFQDIPERRNDARVRVVGNWFRDVLDGLNITLVALGTEEAKRVREANDQVRRRIPAVHTIPYFTTDSPQAIRAWMVWIEKISVALPMAEDPKLAGADVAARLLTACNGIPDYLIKLLCSAVTVAVNAGRELLTLDDLALAFVDIAGQVVETGNPFKPDFHRNKLNGVNELFHRMEKERRKQSKGGDA